LIDIYLPEEKQQIIEAYVNGLNADPRNDIKDAEKYHNETFEQ